MSSKAVKFVALLLIAAVLFCGGSSAYACDADEPGHCPAADSCHHCITHCSCHTAGLPTGGFFLFHHSDQQMTLAADEMKLPLVLESILTPPKH
jgi:hypothetical protein